MGFPHLQPFLLEHFFKKKKSKIGVQYSLSDSLQTFIYIMHTDKE